MNNYNFKDYNTLINYQEFVLVDFFAEWCKPCQELMPILSQAEKIHKKIYFCKINVDHYRNLIVENKVSSFPTLILYHNGKEIKRQIGSCSQIELLNFLNVQ